MPLLTLPIAGVRRETPRNLVIQLALGDIPFSFEAGQYVLLAEHGRQDRRPYSVASAPAEASEARALEFLIQVGEDDSPGPHLPRLAEGVELDMEGPEGSFTLPAGRLGRDLLLVAGGTGIAPVRAILRQLLQSPDAPAIGLVQSGRTPLELPYAGEFRALAAAGRIHLVETVTRDAPDSWQGIRGRIGRAQLQAAMTGPHPFCFVCGPDSLVEDVPRLLAELGVPPSRIYTEHWADQPSASRP